MKKKVLITGFEGFLGSHLTKRLVSGGADVIGLDIEVRRKETILNPQDYKRIKVIKADVSDYGLVRDIIAKNKIEIVFHLAAEALVVRGHKSPLRTFSSNICGTWNVLEACRVSGSIEAVIVASSDKAYGAHKKLPYRESYPLVGSHPYDVSKSCADLISYTYYYSFGLPVAITRCGNIYGPGDFNFSRIVPDAIRSALSGKTLLIRSDGKFIRDYIYIDDIVNSYLILAKNLKKLNLAGEAFNFSDETPIEVKELVKKIYKLSGKEENYKILNQARFEIRNQYLSSAKARRILHWRSKVSLDEGLKKTIAWSREYLKKG